MERPINQIWTTLNTVAPQVESRTGYQLDLATMQVELVSHKRFGKVMRGRIYRSLGVIPNALPITDRIWHSVETVVENNAYGAYSPFSGTMFVNNGFPDYSYASFGNTAIHELVHRGQFNSNPGLTEQWKKNCQEIFSVGKPTSPTRRKQVLRDQKLLSGFIESEAYRIASGGTSHDPSILQRLGNLATLPFVLELLYIMGKWSSKKLSREDRDIIMFNPDKIAFFYHSDKRPTQLSAA